MHHLGDTTHRDLQVLMLLGAYFDAGDLLDDEEESIEEGRVDDFLRDLVGECDEAGFDRLVALVLRVGDVIVELHDLLQQHEHVIRLQFLVAGDGHLLRARTLGIHIVDVHVVLQQVELLYEHSLLDLVEVGHQCLADHRNGLILETVNHRAILHVPHLVINHLNRIHEGLQQVQLEVP